MPNKTLCHQQELLEGQSKGFQIDASHSLFAVRKNQNIYLYKNSCPHLGIELEWLEDQFLDADNQLIQCSTHGALFLIEDGQCVSGPCQGQSLEAFPFILNENGEIEIELHLL